MNRSQRRAQPKQTGLRPTRLLNPAGQREFESAVQLMKDGRWPESAAAHKRVLTHNARHAPTLHHLGLIAFKSGQASEAVDALRLALSVEPNYIEARLNLAVILKLQGALQEALTECRSVLAKDTGSATVHAEHGHILKEMGQYAEAIPAYRCALKITPAAQAAQSGLALCLFEQQQYAEVVVICRAILAQNPAHAVMRKLLIRALAGLGELAEARNSIASLVINETERSALLSDIASGLHSAGRSAQAIALLREALQSTPDAVDLLLMSGSILYDTGRLQEAFDALKQALDRDPARAEGYVTLGFVLYAQGLTDGAIQSLQHACTLRPDFAAAHYALGSVLRVAGRFEDARTALERAFACDPRALDAQLALTNVRRSMCDWDGLDAQEAQCISEIRAADTAITPFLLLGLDVTNDDMRAGGERYTRQTIAKMAARTAPVAPYQTYVKSDDRITIGYLSSDFGHHATSMLFAEALEQHDRQRFKVMGYCYSPDDGSPLRQRMIAACDDFVSINTTDHHAVAARIRADGVEILVDLKGFTRDARQEILALKPAPIQVSYLGYPGTTGAPYLDYVLADSIVAPMAHQPSYSEKIVHLESCYQPNDRQRQIASQAMTRAEHGLPETAFVFCSFNNTFKLNRRFFAIWMRLLHQVPGSVLWLLQKTSTVRDNLRREAFAHGIDPDRLIFADPLPNDRHLARHALADLFLDSLPCTAHTTASDALWAGLPVLTCLGPTFAGRVAASVLNAAGLPDLITRSTDAYEALALKLAHHPDELAAIKARLSANRNTCALFDTPRYVTSLQNAYTRMSAAYRAGEQPQSFTVAPTDV